MINETKNDNIVPNRFIIWTVRKGLTNTDHFRDIKRIDYLKCLNDLKNNSKLVIRTKSGEEYIFGRNMHEKIIINHFFLFDSLEHASEYEESYLDIELKLKAEHVPIFEDEKRPCRRITKRYIIKVDSIESIEIIDVERYEC